jgi:Ca2+-binding EF-hand superfamily protein
MTLSAGCRLFAVIGASAVVWSLLLMPKMTAQDAPKAAAKKAPDAKKLPPPTQYKDFVFLASQRPVLIRLHVQMESKPHYEKFFDFFKEFFAQLDHDKDGVLGTEEVKLVPQAQFMQRLMQGQFFFGDQQGRQKVATTELDTDKNGKVSVTEFTDYYRRNNIIPLRLVASSGSVNTDRLNDAILKQLGAEKEGKLTEASAGKAREVFGRLDKNEDELITADEIAPPQQNRAVREAPAAAPPMPPAPPETGIVDIAPGQPLDAAAQRLLRQFDKDKDEKLTRAEIGLGKEDFETLDANKDENLDKTELAKFFQRDADLEIVARLGKLDEDETTVDLLPDESTSETGAATQGPSRIDLYNPKKRPMALAADVTRVDKSTLRLKIGESALELRAADENAQARNRFQFLIEQFRALDSDMKGVVEKTQAMQNPQILALFELANRAGDGKLTEKELKDYLDLQTAGSNCVTTVQCSDQGRSLFELFDANHDGRLSLRELQSVWSVVQPLPRASDSSLSKSEIPRRLTVAIGPGQFVSFARQPARTTGQGGLLWFTKLDRNNDGDVSPAEFLASEEDFRLLDANQDGLISAEEARHWETNRKKKH